MDYYLIWTDDGWLKTPTYRRAMCSGFGEYESIDTTHDIRRACRLDERQGKECIQSLQRHGVASWIVEVKEEMLNNILQELSRRKEKNNE